MTKPTQREFLSFAYNIGFRYFEKGTMRNKEGKSNGFYIKGDLTTDEIKQAFKDKFGKWVGFYVAVPEYAPELKKSVILLKNANGIRN
jgi:hypothetical protein